MKIIDYTTSGGNTMIGVDFMPGIVADMAAEEKRMQNLIKSDTEVATFAEEWDKEYEFRKKLVLARKESGLTQKDVGVLSGLDYRAVSRAESSEDVSPSLKTLIKYLSAIGYQLDIVKAQPN